MQHNHLHCSVVGRRKPIISMAPSLSSHVVIFPFMAHSHTLPLLDLSKALSRQHVKVTVVTIASNVKAIDPRIAGFPNISLAELPFPSNINGLPNGCETLSEIPSIQFFLSFLTATKHLREPFEQLLQSMKNSADLPLCVISDFFLGWTLGICQTFGIPRLVFHGTCILSSLISKTIMLKTDYVKSSSISVSLDLLLPNLPFSLTPADLPDVRLSTDESNPFTEFMAEAGKAEEQSWGIVVNSFLELERDYLSTFESFYTSGAKSWCVGPTFLYGKMDASGVENGNHRDENFASLMNWLDTRAAEGPASVIYVAFGTQAVVSDGQLDEVALGLEESGCPFVFVVRSKSWSAPNGLEERVRKRGLIVRKFVDQSAVLLHSATGGFMSHCGWNSVLESMAASVPILAWPMMAEQKLNAKYIVDGLGFGVGLEKGTGSGSGMIVSRENISTCVKDLMLGEKGRKAKEKARELGKQARQAVEDGGSSTVTLQTLLQKLRACYLENP